MSNDHQPTLPNYVPVPTWPSRPTNVKMDVHTAQGTRSGSKVTGSLELCAMDADDVFVEGTLTYRGNSYPIKYIHTNDAGQPKGYWYPRDEAERVLRDAQGGSSQIHGVIPQDGSTDWALAQAVGDAPKTYRRPLLDALADTVQRYLRDHAQHAAEARLASATQNANRKAESYNRLAQDAAKALVEYEAAVMALVDAGAALEAVR